MKHTTSRMLFAYWDALRGERAAPERGAIQPGAMRHVLADSFVLGRDGTDGAIFRLAGSRCAALFCRDLKGDAFADLWPAEARAEPDRLVEIVTGDMVGAVAGLAASNVNGSALALELLLLPLRHRGKTDVRLIGALSPAAFPSWAGLVPLARIETRSVRIIETASRPGFGPGPDALPPRRNLFVVHEGGRP